MPLKDSLQRSVTAVSDAQHTITTSLSQQKESLVTAQRAELSLCEEMLRTQHLQDLEELRSQLSTRHQVRSPNVLCTYWTMSWWPFRCKIESLLPWFLIALTCPVLSRFALSCPVLFYSTLYHPSLHCHLLRCDALFYLFLYYARCLLLIWPFLML